MELLSVSKSDRWGKKLMATFKTDTGRTRTTHFGASGYEDFTTHHDLKRRDRYRQRHEKDLKTGDPTKAGYLAYWLLWGDSTSLATNITAYKKKFNL